MADNLNKRPKKGILKNSSSFDTQDSHPSAKVKETKWDEMNIIATLHPADKTYGHMKIDEPKTPYNYDTASADEQSSLDATDLAARIAQGCSEPAKVLQEQLPDEEADTDEEELTPEELQQRKDFENKRKKHYNEYYALKLARRLLEEEEDDEDDDHDKQQGPSGSQQPAPPQSPQHQRGAEMKKDSFKKEPPSK